MFKFKELLFLKEVFNFITLQGKNSRYRTRFLKAVNEKYRQFEEERITLLKETALLDDFHNLLLDENNQAMFANMEKAKQFSEEFQILLEETVELSLDTDTFNMVTQIILEGEFQVQGEYAEIYDDLCNRLEKEKR